MFHVFIQVGAKNYFENQNACYTPGDTHTVSFHKDTDFTFAICFCKNTVPTQTSKISEAKIQEHCKAVMFVTGKIAATICATKCVCNAGIIRYRLKSNPHRQLRDFMYLKRDRGFCWPIATQQEANARYW